MIRITQNFQDKLEAGYRPFFFVVLQSTQSRRIFGKELPPIPSGTGLWDGSWAVGDGTRGGIDLGLTDVRANVLQFGSNETRLAVNSRDLLTSLSMGEIGTFQVVFDNTDGYFSELMGDDTGESFIQQNFELQCGFHELALVDFIMLFRGIVIQETLTTKTLKIVAEGSSTTLGEVYEMPKTDVYASPAEQNAILPYPYGDLTENSGDSGLWVCPEIDTVNDVYGIAGFALQTEAQGNTFILYDDDGEISDSEYSITNGDYESTGLTITYVTFTTPPNGNVLCTCKGKANSAGTLLTNPIDILEDFLDTTEDITSRNSTSWGLAKSHASSQGFTAAGVITADNTLAFWMTSILSSFLGSWFLNGQQEIMVSLDTDESTMSNIAGVLDESMTVGIAGDRTRPNICNHITMNYATIYSSQDRRFKEDVKEGFLQTSSDNDVYSQSKYGIRKKSIDLSWTRNTATVAILQARILEKYTNPSWTVSFAEQDFRVPQVEPGDFILYSWRERKDENSLALKNQIARVLGVNQDYDRLTISLTLWDTGEFWTQEPKKWDGLWAVGDGTTGGGIRDRRNLN